MDRYDLVTGQSVRGAVIAYASHYHMTEALLQFIFLAVYFPFTLLGALSCAASRDPWDPSPISGEPSVASSHRSRQKALGTQTGLGERSGLKLRLSVGEVTGTRFPLCCVRAKHFTSSDQISILQHFRDGSACCLLGFTSRLSSAEAAPAGAGPSPDSLCGAEREAQSRGSREVDAAEPRRAACGRWACAPFAAFSLARAVREGGGLGSVEGGVCRRQLPDRDLHFTDFRRTVFKSSSRSRSGGESCKGRPHLHPGICSLSRPGGSRGALWGVTLDPLCCRCVCGLFSRLSETGQLQRRRSCPGA
ncbi:PREDICTED: uncharacterized protein LOC106148690 [Chinchilla lanigera]|uniref:uncharacterized protein LOC106148690 n=1 Tax=Chinchilla lanigera TaxID=34839 RepID=UPI00069701AA|nr:PREDICTED: uncharacterized protein LOC106148690 [Chinchilla lanigera]